MTQKFGRLVVLSASLVALGACSTIREHRGFVMDTQLAEGIQAGVDTKDSVTGTLGQPTFVGQFSPNDWYYLSADTRQLAFANPRIDRSSLLHVRFDAAGNVVEVKRTGAEAIARVAPMKGKTPTLGHKKSFLEELFGNVGTVNSLGQGAGAPQQ